MQKLIDQKILIVPGDATDPGSYPRIGIDLVILDPPFPPKKQPYSQIRKENKVNLAPIETPTKEAYLSWWTKVCANCKAILKKSGWFIFKSDDYGSKFVWELTSQYFDYIGDVIWDKGEIKTGYYIRREHEVLCIYRPLKAHDSFAKLTPKTLQLKSSSHGLSKNKAFRSVIHVRDSNGGEFGSKKRKNINQTPYQVWMPFIENFCPEYGAVFDPTCGSGSIEIACKILDRECHARDIDKKSVMTAIQNVKATIRNQKLNDFLKPKPMGDEIHDVGNH